MDTYPDPPSHSRKLIWEIDLWTCSALLTYWFSVHPDVLQRDPFFGSHQCHVRSKYIVLFDGMALDRGYLLTIFFSPQIIIFMDAFSAVTIMASASRQMVHPLLPLCCAHPPGRSRANERFLKSLAVCIRA